MEKKQQIFRDDSSKAAFFRIAVALRDYFKAENREFSAAYATKEELQSIVENIDKIGGVIDVTVDGTELVVTLAGGTEVRFSINCAYATKTKHAVYADKLTIFQNITLEGAITGTGVFTGDAECIIPTDIDPDALAECLSKLSDDDLQKILDSLFHGAITVEAEEVTDPTTGETKTVTTVYIKNKLVVEGDEEVTGDLTVDGNELVKGDAEVDGDLLVKGNEEVQKDLTVDGNETVKGNLTVSGTITASNGITATQLGTSTVGASATPIYLSSGKATACGYSFTNYLPLSGGTCTGAVNATSFQATSDRRVKTIVGGVAPGLDGVSAYRFKWNDPEKLDDRIHIGLMAQDVFQVLPEAITVDEETGLMRLDYNAVTAALVGTVNALTARVTELEEKVKENGNGSE